MKKYLLSLLIIGVIIEQIVLINAPGVTYDWKAIVLEFIIIFSIAICINGIWLYVFRKCVKEFRNQNWNYMIRSRKVLNLYRYHKKNMARDYSFYMIALAYQELNQDQDFMLYINKIQHPDMINKRYFALSMNALLENNKIIYQMWYDKLLRNDNEKDKEKLCKLLELAIQCQEENYKCNNEEKELIDSLASERFRSLFRF